MSVQTLAKAPPDTKKTSGRNTAVPGAPPHPITQLQNEIGNQNTLSLLKSVQNQKTADETSGADKDSKEKITPISDFVMNVAGNPIPIAASLMKKYLHGNTVEISSKNLPRLGILDNPSLRITLNDNGMPQSADFAGNIKVPFMQCDVNATVDSNGDATGAITAHIDTKKIPMLKGVDLSGKINKNEFSINGDVGYEIPYVSGTLNISYLHAAEKQLLTGKGTAKYQGSRLSGDLSMAISETGLSGSGTLTMELFKGLVGTANVAVDEKGYIKVQGNIQFPATIDLFPEKKFERNFFDFSRKFPLWAIGLPIVGYIGIIAEVHANAGFRSKFGPGVLRDIVLDGEFGTDPEAATTFGLTGEIFIPAGAEIYLIAGGGIGLSALIVDLTGGINLKGIAGLYTALSARPSFRYEGGKYHVGGEAELAGAAQLRAGIDAYAKIQLDTWIKTITLWEQNWKLAEWIWDTGLNFSLKAGFQYTLGEEFTPQISFEAGSIDAEKLIKDVMPESGQPVPASANPPKPAATKLTLEGQKGGEVETAAKQPETPNASTPTPTKTKGKTKVKADDEKAKEKVPEETKKESPERTDLRVEGENALSELVEESETQEFDDEAMDAKLQALRSKYPFKELKIATLEEGTWVIAYSMSPGKTKRARAPKVHSGTHKDPIPIIWQKRPLRDYKPVELKTDPSDPKSKEEYAPTRRKKLGGSIIGVSPDYRTSKGMKVGPKKSGRQDTEKERFKDLLKKHGYDRTSTPDGETDADHVVELFLSGPDDFVNLWPLNSKENQTGGSRIANMNVRFKKGNKIEESSLLDLADGKYYFIIEDFDTSGAKKTSSML